MDCTLEDIYNSKRIVKEYAIYHNICPKCRERLKLITYYEPKCEHFGYPASEEISELRCDCGWNDGID